MKIIILVILILVTFNSCGVVRSLLGYNECAYEGCDRQALDNCSYCGFHCESNILPSDFNAKVGKSIDRQVERSRSTTTFK